MKAANAEAVSGFSNPDSGYMLAATAPVITGQPINQTVTLGSSASFGVTVTGTALLAYQWQKNGMNIAGAISATLTINKSVHGDEGSYRCVAKNVAGTVTSASAVLVVTDPSDPPDPTNVNSSDSVYPDKIRVTWEGVSEATGYEVWRSLGEISGFAVKLEETITTNYDDTAVEADTTYYYWVKAKNTSGTSGFSKSDPGCVLVTNMVIRPAIGINNLGIDEVTLARGQMFSVAINLATSSHLEADWWMLAETPFGVYYYNASDGGWYPTDMDNLKVTYQGQLFTFLEPFEVLEMDTMWLNNGKYIFYFGVDITRNGELDFDKLYYSSVTLDVTE